MTIPTMAPWRACIDDYLSWLGSGRASRETKRLRAYHLTRLASGVAVGPWEVDVDTLAAWLDGQPWSRSTTRSVRSSLTGFYTWAIRTGRTSTNPVDGLPRLPVEHGRKREPASDIAVAWGVRAKDPRVRLMVLLGARLGMRRGEIARARREDLLRDLVGWSMSIDGKGGRRRIVPCPDDLAAELRTYPPGHLFPGAVDGHLSEHYVGKLMSAAMPEGQTAHMLRHRRAAKAYVQTGRDLRAVQELLGHASVATTEIYVPAEREQLRLAVGGDL